VHRISIINTSNEMQLYLGFYFKILYMFRAFIMPILRSNITAQTAVGTTNECGTVKCSVRSACPGLLVVTSQQLSCNLTKPWAIYIRSLSSEFLSIRWNLILSFHLLARLIGRLPKGLIPNSLFLPLCYPITFLQGVKSRVIKRLP
jgi:hypothetical protein